MQESRPSLDHHREYEYRIFSNKLRDSEIVKIRRKFC